MRISIVIPCYNVGSYISDCLNSVIDQTYDNIEMICVNDGSTDNTRSIIEDIANKTNVEIIIIDRPNGGQCAARNTGIKASSSDYIHTLDADDLMLPGKIENISKLINKEKDPPCFIVGDYIHRKQDKSEYVKKADDRTGWYGLFASNLGITSSLTWRKKCLESVGYWDEDAITSVEMELIFSLLKNNHRFIHDRDPKIIHREREEGGSITQKNKDENIVRQIELRKRILQYLIENDLITEDLEDHAYQSFFIVIRRLYVYDRERAMHYFHELIPKNFIPKASLAITRKYIKVYRSLGFKHAQRLHSLYNLVS